MLVSNNMNPKMQANPTIQVLLDWLLSMEQKNYRRYAKSYKKNNKEMYRIPPLWTFGKTLLFNENIIFEQRV